MSIARVLLAAIVGGVIVFTWGFVSHVVLPLGEIGIKTLPVATEDAMFAATRGVITERGFYFLPGMTETTPEAQAAWETKYSSGPRGVLVYDPSGGKAMDPAMMGTEFGSGALAALIAAIVLSTVCAGYVGRVAIVVGMGVFAWASIDLSYWNWYRFPTDFMLAQLADQAIGWMFAGMGMAAIVRCSCCDTCQPCGENE